MNGVVSDDFQSRCEIEEPFEQFVLSFSDYRLMTLSATVNFTQAPGTDVCSSSYEAVLREIISLLQNK